MQKDKEIFVTQPFLPPLPEFEEYLKNIWDTKILTNNGPYHQQLEAELCSFLKVPYISLFCNATIALVTALQALRITGEVITTPYSFVATTHALNWNGIKPVFADIDEHNCNLNPEKIEAAITSKTTAILPVHVYGNPVDVTAIGKIADTYGLKLIYDASHAFGVTVGGESILNFGDLSVLSFHATKSFNTFEGGAIISHDKKTKQRIDYLKNFGFSDEVTVVAPGINGKMNEIQAAMGLLQLKYYNQVLQRRQEISDSYYRALKGVTGIRLLEPVSNAETNYSYFPIFVGNNFGCRRDELYQKLKEHNIFTRRYFYPLITKFSTYRGLESAQIENLPVAEKVSNEVLCLPIYPDLQDEDQKKIIHLILTCIN